MKGRQASTFVLIGIVMVLMIGIVLLINGTTIFQEGDPFPLLGGIWQIAVEGRDYAVVKDEPPTYITKTGDNKDLFARIEQDRSVMFREETDAGYVFEGEGGKLTVTVRQYSRSYQIWEIKE